MRPRRVMVVLLAVGLLTAPTTGAAAAATVGTVTYGVVSWNPLHWVVMAGAVKGHFERHGLKLDLVVTGNASAAVQALMGGSMQMTTTTPTAAFFAQDKTPEMKQIIGVYERCPYSLVVNPEIKRIEDLRGRVVGGTGVKTSSDIETLRTMLHAHGLQDGRDYTVTVAGSVQMRTQALLNKTIWAVAQMEPYTTFLTDHGMVELARAADSPNLRLVETVTVVAMRPWYTANQETAVRFLRGWADATQWLYDPKNRAEAVQIPARDLKVSEKYAENTYRVWVEELKAHPKDVRLSPAGLRKVLENMIVLGDLKPPVPDLAPYVDFSLADKLGRR